MGVHSGGAARAQLHRAGHRRVLLDPEMRPIPVVVRQVLAEQPPKMFVVENNDVVEQVSPYGPHESLGHPVGASCRMRPMRAVRRDGSG